MLSARVLIDALAWNAKGVQGHEAKYGAAARAASTEADVPGLLALCFLAAGALWP